MANGGDLWPPRAMTVRVGLDLIQRAWVITPMAGPCLLRRDAPDITDFLGIVTDAAIGQQLRPAMGVTPARSLALPQKVLPRGSSSTGQ